MSMSLLEARSEIKKLYDEGSTLTKKHGGALTIDVNADDFARIETIKAELLA